MFITTTLFKLIIQITKSNRDVVNLISLILSDSTLCLQSTIYIMK